ncbi:MAG: hypothetical protein WDM89_07690 [Rhizomicrobium sp.]
MAQSDSDQMPKYDSSMLPDDVAELFARTLGSAGYDRVKTSSLTPHSFGAETGFAFDLSFTTPDGLEMKGKVLASQPGKKLDAILFFAPNEYYFDHYADSVGKLFASARLDGH